MAPQVHWPAPEREAILARVERIEMELGLGNYLAYRKDPETAAFKWNSVVAGTLVDILGPNALRRSALVTARSFRTGCSGLETVGLSVECLKVPLWNLGYSVQMQLLCSCVYSCVGPRR